MAWNRQVRSQSDRVGWGKTRMLLTEQIRRLLTGLSTTVIEKSDADLRFVRDFRVDTLCAALR